VRPRGRDARFGTELTRLGAVGQLTSSEVATGIRVAGVYGRFEYYANQRRSAASPHYIREYISEGAGSDTEAVNFAFKEGRERDRSFNPDDREIRERDAVIAFMALQEILPAEVRAQLEMLCVEDRHVGYQGLIRARNGRSIVGQAELGSTIGGMGKWTRARAEQQIVEWFGSVPDFVITLFAPYADQCDDASFVALVEHELYHCSQQRDEFGMPRFKKSTGMPAFCMRGHDVEEFVGVVRRYGADAAGVRAMIDAAAEGPTIASAGIGFACGNCPK
jgi:hypothetical protein